MTVATRSVHESDRTFLVSLVGDSRGFSPAALGWDADATAAFAALQFEAQSRAFAVTHPDARHAVVECDGEPVGRLVTDRTEGELEILDIALIPSRRGEGIGTAVLEGLQRVAAGEGRALTLQVALGNPAQHLYARLGFEEEGVEGMHTSMRWRPDGQSPDAARLTSVGAR